MSGHIAQVKSRRTKLPALLLALLVLAGCAGGEDLRRFGAACRIDERSALTLTVARNFLLAPVQVDGADLQLVVDTGAEATLLTPETVEDLGLARDPARRSVLMGVGGLVHSQNATIHQLRIGRLIRTEHSVGVGAIGHIDERGTRIGGLLGTDILSHYDVEIDVPRRRIAFYDVSGCSGFIPWGGAATAVPVRFNRQGLTFLPLTVDDRPVRALLDTGARSSLMTRQVAASLGVTEMMLQADPARGGTGVGLASIQLHQHHFDRVALGAITVRDMAVNVADMRLPGVEMLLGADWLALVSRHVWLSYASGMLFIHR